MQTLIIGYGNPLRGDDAAGYEAAGRLGALAVPQLTPELADEISRAEQVIFIDAADGPDAAGTLRETPVLPGPSPEPFTHRLTPESLLGLAEALYGRAPRAVLITVAGENFSLGAPLSPGVAAALDRLCLTLRAKGPIL